MIKIDDKVKYKKNINNSDHLRKFLLLKNIKV